MDTANFPIPASLDEVKQLFEQFQMFLPEDKRAIIWETLNQIEANGGIKDEAQGKEMLASLLAALGMSN